MKVKCTKEKKMENQELKEKLNKFIKINCIWMLIMFVFALSNIHGMLLFKAMNVFGFFISILGLAILLVKNSQYKDMINSDER